MKKIGLLFIGLLLIMIMCVYIFIPSSIKISDYSISPIPQLSMTRALQNYAQWDSDSSSEKEISFTKYKPLEDGVSLTIKAGNIDAITYIQALNLRSDSTLIQYKIEFKSSKNPITRIKDYFKAVKIKRELTVILKHLTSWSLSTKNVYGFNLERTTFIDTLFIVDTFVRKDFPSLQEINSHLSSLENYVKSNSAMAKNYTIQNISDNDHQYSVIIALCINKEVPETATFKIKRMPINRLGNLTAEVIGGYHLIDLAHSAIKNYLRDYQLQIKALPFEILFTNRANTDSTKWETIVNYPCTPNYY